MERLLRTKFDFVTSRTLFGPQATAAHVLAEIERVARVSQVDDMFALTFSGHGDQGTQAAGTGPPDHEPDGHDEAWALHDRLLLDDEIGAAMLDFINRGKIIIFTDSCHSRTVSWFHRPDRGGGTRLARLGLSGSPHGRPRALAPGTRNHLIDKFPEIYDEPIRAARRKRAEEARRPRLVSLAACLDDELAGEDDQSGYFTGVVLDLCSAGFEGSYQELINEAKSRVAQYGQTPGLYWYPGSAAMIDERFLS